MLTSPIVQFIEHAPRVFFYDGRLMEKPKRFVFELVFKLKDVTSAPLKVSSRIPLVTVIVQRLQISAINRTMCSK